VQGCWSAGCTIAPELAPPLPASRYGKQPGVCLAVLTRIRRHPGTVFVMGKWEKGWKPSTAGEAREYLDAHEREGDPAIVEACEALFDATPHLSGLAKPSPEQLEEEGAD